MNSSTDMGCLRAGTRRNLRHGLFALTGSMHCIVCDVPVGDDFLPSINAFLAACPSQYENLVLFDSLEGGGFRNQKLFLVAVLGSRNLLDNSACHDLQVLYGVSRTMVRNSCAQLVAALCRPILGLSRRLCALSVVFSFQPHR